jgi:hypothetical protein
MSNDPIACRTAGEFGTKPKNASGWDSVCGPSTHVAVQKLAELRGQLLALFFRLQQGEMQNQSLQLREDISRLIWVVDDWQIQYEARN